MWKQLNNENDEDLHYFPLKIYEVYTVGFWLNRFGTYNFIIDSDIL